MKGTFGLPFTKRQLPVVFPTEFQVAVDAPDPQGDGLGAVGLQKIELILFQIPLGEPGIEGEEEFAAVVVGLDCVWGELSLSEICFK